MRTHEHDGRTILDLGLTDHCDELMASLMHCSSFDSEHGGWLRDRYADIVPTVLPDALRCVETGDALSEASRSAIRTSAVAMRSSTVPFAVVLRGGVPAIRVFGTFMLEQFPSLGARDLAVAMGRAALISHELGACWAEEWVGQGAAFDGDNLEVVAVTGDVKSPALEMLALAAAGHSNHQIAEATDYSSQAVKWHLARVMRSWNVGNRAALVSVAFLRGVLTARTSRPERPGGHGRHD